MGIDTILKLDSYKFKYPLLSEQIEDTIHLFFSVYVNCNAWEKVNSQVTQLFTENTLSQLFL